jgi:hypothetical protein
MALTITYDGTSGGIATRVTAVGEKLRFLTGVIDFDASYPTGGEALDFGTMLNGASLKGVVLESKSGYVFEYDYTNKKIKAMQRHVVYTAAVDPASIATDAIANTAVTVTGVVTADRITAIPPNDLEAGLVMQSAWASGANQVTVRLQNVSAGAVDGVSKTWTFIAYGAADREVPDTTDLSTLTDVRFVAWGV